MTILMASTWATAETIYIWTDRDGVRHFSDQPPPEGTTKTDKIEAPSSTEQAIDSEDRRQSIERMTEEYRREAQEAEQNRQQKEKDQAEANARRRQESLEEKIEAERQRLLDEIAAIRNRGVSRTYSQGMKNAQIEAIEKQLEKLAGDPQGYFNSR